jgi:hypothetical protein
MYSESMSETSSRERLEADLHVWARALNIHEYMSADAKAFAAWVDLCAPVRASHENRLLACKDLSVVLFTLDDYEGDDYLDLFAACEAALDLAPPASGPQWQPLVRAYSAVVREVEAKGFDTSQYKAWRRALLREYRQRNRVRQAGETLDSGAHLERRRTTVYTRQWINLWEILEGCPLSSEDRSSALTIELLEQMVEWQVLENELVSVDRDLARGEQNLIAIISRERSMSLQSAAGMVTEAHGAATRRLEALLRDFRDSFSSQRQQGYADILERCYRGAIEINQVRLARYRRMV